MGGQQMLATLLSNDQVGRTLLYRQYNRRGVLRGSLALLIYCCHAAAPVPAVGTLLMLGVFTLPPPTLPSTCRHPWARWSAW